eukprot:tig00000361_g24422.t1
MGLFEISFAGDIDLSKVDGEAIGTAAMGRAAETVGHATERLSDNLGRAAERLSDTLSLYTPGKVFLGIVAIIAAPIVTIKLVDCALAKFGLVGEQKHRVAHEHGVVRVERDQ